MSWLTGGASQTGARLGVREMRGQIEAINRSQAVIEFEPDGTIIRANENFLNTVGYTLDEIRGRHHRMFVDPQHHESAEYKAFWEKLGRGEYDAAQYRRIGKGGREIWIQASYNPVIGRGGRTVRVVKFATDITAQKLREADFVGQLAAIGKAQAVIEFDLTGNILAANENFLTAMGYALDEIKGRHHSMFVDDEYRESAEYKAFWEKLGRGEYEVGLYRRIGKGGREVWIRASYNAILDARGLPFKVVKYASDATEVTAMRMAVEEVRGVAAAAETDDLSKRVSMEGRNGDIAELCAGVNGLMDKFVSVLSDLRGVSQKVSAASGEIAQSAGDLSKRTEQQAASLEETAAALDQITATVRKTADGARHANEVVASARTGAEESGEVVRGAVAAMTEIEKSARQISQIIGVIDEIAFQTNLLALNAGVEAARAGEAGKGFAVVASEVRALAQRSADAAKEIKGLISASTAQVENGVDLVGQTGQALERLVRQVGEINSVVSEIAASAQEQATGLGQVNTAVNQMDQMTQQNAAMVEQSTAASHTLLGEAQDMAGLIARFQIEDAPEAELARAQNEAEESLTALAAVARGRGRPARGINLAVA